VSERYRLIPGACLVQVTAMAPGHKFVAKGAGLSGTVELDGSTVTSIDVQFRLQTLKAPDPIGQRQLSKFLEFDRDPIAEAHLAEPATVPGAAELVFTIGSRRTQIRAELMGSPPSGSAKFPLTFTSLGYTPPKLLFLKVADSLTIDVSVRVEPAE